MLLNGSLKYGCFTVLPIKFLEKPIKIINKNVVQFYDISMTC